MSNALIHNADALFFAGTAADAETAAPAVQPTHSATPVGYRRVSKRWRIGADRKRDYAAYHGKTAFEFLLPVSSRLRSKR